MKHNIYKSNVIDNIVCYYDIWRPESIREAFKEGLKNGYSASVTIHLKHWPEDDNFPKEYYLIPQTLIARSLIAMGLANRMEYTGDRFYDSGTNYNLCPNVPVEVTYTINGEHYDTQIIPANHRYKMASSSFEYIYNQSFLTMPDGWKIPEIECVDLRYDSADPFRKKTSEQLQDIIIDYSVEVNWFTRMIETAKRLRDKKMTDSETFTWAIEQVGKLPEGKVGRICDKGCDMDRCRSVLRERREAVIAKLFTGDAYIAKEHKYASHMIDQLIVAHLFVDDGIDYFAKTY